MLIKDVIKLLKKCNQDEELNVSWFDNFNYSQCYLENKVTIECPNCCGDGVEIYEINKITCKDSCHVCDGYGYIESEEDSYTIAEMSK